MGRRIKKVKEDDQDLSLSVSDVKLPTMRKRTRRTTGNQAVSQEVGDIFVSNQHSGPLSIPSCKLPSGVIVPPVNFIPGVPKQVDRVWWNGIKNKFAVVRHWLDRNMLVESTRNRGQVPVMDSTSTDLPIPEMLQGDEHESGQHPEVRASIRKQNVTHITI